MDNHKGIEENNLLVKLPCKIGDTVYTISLNSSPCEKCQHGEKVGYDVSECLHNHSNYECPPPEFYIESHIVEGFEISKGCIDLIEEWGYENIHIQEPYYTNEDQVKIALKNQV